MTEEERKAIEQQYKNGIVYVSSIVEPLIEQFKVDKGSIDIQQLQLVCDYLIKDRDFDESYVNDLEEEIKSKDTEINKLNNVIDRTTKYIEELIGSCPYDTFDYQVRDCEKECKDQMAECWKEYFMKEE